MCSWRKQTDSQGKPQVAVVLYGDQFVEVVPITIRLLQLGGRNLSPHNKVGRSFRSSILPCRPILCCTG